VEHRDCSDTYAEVHKGSGRDTEYGGRIDMMDLFVQ
jgi:hypothetical protein